MQKSKKKQRFILFVGVLLVLCVFSVSSQAIGDQKILVYVDGKKVAFPDQQPYIDANNRTMVPVRFVSEGLGAKVDWRSPKVDIKHEAKDKEVTLQVDKKDYYVNGEKKTMDTKAVLTKQKRVVVPLRFVSEALGANVRWEVVSKTGVVFTFTMGQSDEEIQEIISQVKEEIMKQEDREIVFVGKVGIDIEDTDWEFSKQGWLGDALSIFKDNKVVFVTVDDIKEHSYQLQTTCTVLDFRMDEEFIYVKQKGAGAAAKLYLAEENNVKRQRESDQFMYAPGTYEAKYLIVNDRRDQYIPMTTCDIEDISHLILLYGGNCLAIENPKYKGAK